MDAPETITVDAGSVALAARSWPGEGRRPVLLVHGLSSNARLWNGVGDALAAAGHPVVAVDLRGHGSSAAVPDPADDRGATRTAADDLAVVCAALAAAPVVAGQSWGGKVVVQLAADHPELVHALVLVDGGWLHLGDRWDGIEAAWEVLAPPAFVGVTAAEVRARLVAAHPDWSAAAVDGMLANLRERPDGTVVPRLERARHREVLASLLRHRPRELYPRVACRCLLLAATTADGPPQTRALLDEALAAWSRGELVEFPGGDHDLHAQYPNRVAELIGGLA